MGGEWWFNFILENKDSFDLKAYQLLLPKLKAEFEPKFEEAEDDLEVVWCPDETIPPEDNIFARFTYTCYRSHHSSWGSDHPFWLLFWDPTIIPGDMIQSNIHGRCGPCYGIGSQLQSRLVKAFPKHFDYENDCVSEAEAYWNSAPNSPSSSSEDFAACDKDDCGYCGKCRY